MTKKQECLIQPAGAGCVTLAEQLDSHDYLVGVPVGSSMWPMLRSRRDSVLIEKPQAGLKRWDVALYRRDSGQVVLHRIMAVKEDQLVACGDYQWNLEKIRHDQILGVVRGFYRDERYRDCTDPRYRGYVWLWCSSMTIRRLVLLLARLIRKVRGILLEPR